MTDKQSKEHDMNSDRFSEIPYPDTYEDYCDAIDKYEALLAYLDEQMPYDDTEPEKGASNSFKLTSDR